MRYPLHYWDPQGYLQLSVLDTKISLAQVAGTTHLSEEQAIALGLKIQLTLLGGHLGGGGSWNRHKTSPLEPMNRPLLLMSLLSNSPICPM